MEDHKPPRVPVDVVVLFALCVALWLAWGLWGARLMAGTVYVDPGVAIQGQFGDLFGGINALFTALAFAAVWWTGRLQKEQLDLQRTELSRQHNELRLQRFESLFFSQIEIFRSVVDRVSYGTETGTRAVAKISFQAKNYLTTAALNCEAVDFKTVYSGRFEEEFFRIHEINLGPFYRTLFHIFEVLDRQEFLVDSMKVTYANIVRAQLNIDMVYLVAAIAIIPRSANFKPLIERYGLLNHMPRDDMWFNEYKGCISDLAFEA